MRGSGRVAEVLKVPHLTGEEEEEYSSPIDQEHRSQR